MTPRGRTRAMTIVTLAIVLLSTAAFARTQMLKQEEPPIAGIRFDGRVVPGCNCPQDEAELSFTLDREQPITASIVAEDGTPVRTLVEDRPTPSGRETLTWDGTGEDGEALPEGEYRLQVELTSPDEVITIPADVRVEADGDAAAASSAAG